MAKSLPSFNPEAGSHKRTTHVSTSGIPDFNPSDARIPDFNPDEHGSASRLPAKHQHKSVGGFFHNLASGIESAAVGIGPGAYTAATSFGGDISNEFRHPGHAGEYTPFGGKKSKFYKRVAKPIGKTYAQTYSPLVHGNLKGFGENVYENPFGPLLDIATLATGGAGAVGKAGGLLGKAGVISKTSRLAELSSPDLVTARASLKAGERTKGIKLTNAAGRAGQEGGRTIVKQVSRNPLVRARQHAIDRMLKRIPESVTPLNKLLGEDARFGRASRRDVYHESRRLRVLGYPFEVAWHRLNKTERIAFSYHADALHPLEEAKFLKAEHPNFAVDENLVDVKAAISRAEDEKVIREFEHPSKKLQAAITEGKALSRGLQEDRLAKGAKAPSTRTGALEGTLFDETAFTERPFLHLRLTRGAEFVKTLAEGKALRAGRIHVARIQKLYDRQEERVIKSRDKMIATEAKKYLPVGEGGAPLRAGLVRARPRTLEEAQARVAAIDSQYNALVDGLAAKYGHPEYGTEFGGRTAKTETARRNVSNAKFRKQGSGRTAKGRASGASGAKVQKLQPTLRTEARNAAEKQLEGVLATTTEPSLVRLRELIAERDDLAARVSAYQEQALSGHATGDFGSVKVQPKERGVAKARPGEPSTPADFAATALGNKVLTHDYRLLTPHGGTRLELLGGGLSLAKTRVEQLEAAALKRHGYVPEHMAGESIRLHGGPSIEELKAEGRDPFYVPDIVKAKKPSSSAAGLGRGVPAKESALRQNLGRVFRNGALYRDPEALHIGHLRQVRSQLATSIHDALLENGVRIDAETLVPRGWEYIRADASQQIGHLMRTRGEVLHELRDFSGEVKFTGTKAEAEEVNGQYIVVPKAYADQLTGEFTRSSAAVRALWEKPTKVWRALVLGLRPGFFTNNVVGNYLLYGLRHHNWNSVMAWVKFLKETHQQRALDELGQDVTFRRLAMQHMPELFYGTFGRTAFEDLPGIGKLGRFRQGFGPATVKVAEETPRLMIAREVVIREMRRLGHDIPKQTADFNRLSEEMLQRPGLAGQAVEEANRTLGDYLHYSPLEERIRDIIPFYGWVRAITKIALQTTMDTPQHALLVTRLGQLAVQENESKYGPLPDYLQGLIPLTGVKNGQVGGVTSAGLNPAATIANVTKGVAGVLAGKPGEGARAISELGPNPFLAALYEWSSGKSMFSGGPVRPTFLPGFAGYAVGSVGENFPQVRLGQTLAGHPRKSKTYANNANRLAALASIAGFPYKRINLPVANRSARLHR